LFKYYYFYLKIKLNNYFLNLTSESADGRSKHLIYRAGNEVYGRI